MATLIQRHQDTVLYGSYLGALKNNDVSSASLVENFTVEFCLALLYLYLPSPGMTLLILTELKIGVEG
jgi:hypothetical protein